MIENVVLVNSGFHLRRDFSENYLQFGHAPSKRLASSVLGRKKLRRIDLEKRQIINLLGGAHMFRASPDFEKIYTSSISVSSIVAIMTATRKLTSPYNV